MDARGLLETLLQSGQELARSGRDLAEKKLGVPQGGGPERESMLDGLGKGALVGGALGLLLGMRGTRRIAKKAVKLGTLAALGGLAYQALRSWQAGQQQPEPHKAAPGLLEAPRGRALGELSDLEAQQRSVAILRAMIAAAKADGHIDAAEKTRITEHLRQMGLGDTPEELLQHELESPLGAREVAAGADGPEAAAEIYLASVLVLDVDHPAERQYLQDLARELKLDPDLARRLEEQI